MVALSLEQERFRRQSRWEMALKAMIEQTGDEELVRALDRLGFWIGSDICAAEGRVTLPGERVSVKASLYQGESLPPVGVNKDNFPSLLKLLTPCGRSRGGQAGLRFLEIRPLPEELGSIGQAGEIRAAAELEVVGGRPIKINQGEAFGCLFFENGGQVLDGKDLMAVVGKKVKIGGQYGKDWVYIGTFNRLLTQEEIDGGSYLDQPIAIGLRVKENRFFIPKGEEPIEIFNPKIVDYRSFLDQEVLKPVPFGVHPSFWVGETVSTVQLEKRYHGYLFPTIRGGRSWMGFPYLVQTDPRLIKEGTDWPLRIEAYIPPSAPPGYYSRGIDYEHMWAVMFVIEKDKQ